MGDGDQRTAGSRWGRFDLETSRFSVVPTAAKRLSDSENQSFGFQEIFDDERRYAIGRREVRRICCMCQPHKATANQRGALYRSLSSTTAIINEPSPFFGRRTRIDLEYPLLPRARACLAVLGVKSLLGERVLLLLERAMTQSGGRHVSGQWRAGVECGNVKAGSTRISHRDFCEDVFLPAKHTKQSVGSFHPFLTLQRWPLS